MNPKERLDRLSNILGLTLACPYDDRNPEFCPLCDVRKLPVRQRITWVKMLSDDDVEYLATYHQICLHCRETLL